MNAIISIHIHLLGGFRLTAGDEELAAERFRLRKARNLIKLVALAPRRAAHREQLMEQLWPDLEPHWAANNLNQAVFAARRALTTDSVSPADVLLYQNEILSLGESVWVDVEAFEAAADRARASHDPVDYRAALDLYTGELLPEDRYEDWATLRRESLQQEYQQLLQELSQLHASRADYPAAIEALNQIIAHDVLNEEANNGLMRLYALNGQRQQALRQYQTLKDALRRELNLEPDPETTRLNKDIQTGRYPPAAQRKPAPELESPHHNLPSQVSSFIGRQRVIEEVQALLARARLVTLTGSGGVGKTRLSLQVAERVIGNYTDGVWYVELAPVSDPDLVPQVVAAALGLREMSGRSVVDTLATYLKDLQALLILDNCEHLLDACASLADTILKVAARLSLFVSSREALGIAGEITLRVPSLAAPNPRQLPPLAELRGYESVRLFADRVRLVLPSFQVDEYNAPAVAQICSRLDGIPLALELAAARMNLLTSEQIASRLDNAFRLLSGGSRTALPRQQTLRAAIDWSFRLLSQPEQTLFRRLAVFSGGGTLESVEAICTGEGLHSEEILDLLTGLANKSMIQVERVQRAETRYHLLETVRQYAREKLNDSAESLVYHDRHLNYFLELAETTEPQLRTPVAVEKLNLLRQEIDNLRAGLSWALDGEEDARVDSGLRLASALLELWKTQNFHAEGFAWLEKGLDKLPADDDTCRSVRARALYSGGALLLLANRNLESPQWLQRSMELFTEIGDNFGRVRAQSLLAENLVWLDITSQRGWELSLSSVEIARSLNDPWLLGYSLLVCAASATTRKEYSFASQLLEESQALLERTGDTLHIMNVLSSLSGLAYLQGEYEPARAYLNRIMTAAEAIQSNSYKGTALGVRGEVAYMQADFAQMESDFRQAQEIFWQGGIRIPNMWLLRGLGIALKRQQRPLEAADCYLESLNIAREFNDVYGVYAAMAGLAGSAVVAGCALQAVRIQGAVAALFAAYLKPLDPWEQREFDHDLGLARAALSSEEFERGWSAGQALTLEQALQETQDLGNSIQLIDI